MPIRPFTRKQLLDAVTTSPWTTDFRHLFPIPKQWLKRTTIRAPFIKSVRPRDRIKYWNIVPGDQIRLLGDKKNILHEVLSINRISNRVFVKGAVNVSELPRLPVNFPECPAGWRGRQWQNSAQQELSLLKVSTLPRQLRTLSIKRLCGGRTVCPFALTRVVF
jgi:hypothetical protein